MNLKIIPYIENKQVNAQHKTLCETALHKMYRECCNDRLAENYSDNTMRLNKMEMYCFLFDENNKPVQASGCQILSENVVRIYSRYYVFKDFRTANTARLDKTDNFLDIDYCLPKLEKFPLIICSRDKSPSFFKKLKKTRPEVFSSWHIYPSEIELMWRNNFQHIFYTGDVTYIEEIIKK